MSRIFFCFHPKILPETSAYQHVVVALAEGLKALGVEVYANIPYYRTTLDEETYLLSHNAEITPNDCDVVVLSQSPGCPLTEIPPNLFHQQRRYMSVFIDSSDRGYYYRTWEPEFRQFDLILKAHFNCKLPNPTNVVPWAFGLTERIINTIGNMPSFSERKHQLLANFRITHHDVRKRASATFFPAIAPILPLDTTVETTQDPPADPYNYLQWQQTGKRHYPSYYQRLKQSVACAAFGGHYIYSHPTLPSGGHYKPSLFSKESNPPLWQRILNKIDFRHKRIVQWDSWRFWESLAAGCVTFHADFELHGIELPVMPENWIHYIGVDLRHSQAATRRIAADPACLERISEAGRQWAIAHYSPTAIATRFLQLVDSFR